jgi:hypothetical protein
MLLPALTILLLGGGLPAAAQTVDFTDEPGYVDFGRMTDLSRGEEIVEIHLTQPLLGIAQWAVRDEDPQLAEMLAGLKLLRVNVFSFTEEEAGGLAARIDEITERLSGQGWNRIVKVRDQDQLWNVMVLMDTEGGSEGAPLLNGLAIVGMGDEESDYRYSDEKGNEAVFVNVVGRLDFAKLSALGRHFGIPQLEGMDDGTDEPR